MADTLRTSRPGIPAITYITQTNNSLMVPMGVFKVQASVCGLSHENKSTNFIAGGAFLMVLIVTLTFIRLGGKIVSKRLGRDDFLIVICFLLGMVTSSLSILSKKYYPLLSILILPKVSKADTPVSRRY